ncbi:MAG: hypothetical protein GOVbin1096_124 [Prokaryotic dsDNA virus sp.]|jgi:hypothetical protein|nr:MAG: hypothetical protein GOVbin1096_124 [Prokaryotic dsDNA virus sp.]|tara:strand:- start:31102 stop:31491 length:390 start_codon:yes stop_codon:yes gene_type:complete
MRTETTVKYITNDGREFTDETLAKEHENAILHKVRAFKVRHRPDLTEGRGMQAESYILVHANGMHGMFAEHECYKRFGNKVEFCMGVYGSNAIVYNWVLLELENASDIPESKMDSVIKLEERFVKKLWE